MSAQGVGSPVVGNFLFGWIIGRSLASGPELTDAQKRAVSERRQAKKDSPVGAVIALVLLVALLIGIAMATVLGAVIVGTLVLFGGWVFGSHVRAERRRVPRV